MFFGKKKKKKKKQNSQIEHSKCMIAGDRALQGTVLTSSLGCIRSDSSDMFNMSAVFPSCSNPSPASLSLFLSLSLPPSPRLWPLFLSLFPRLSK